MSMENDLSQNLETEGNERYRLYWNVINSRKGSWKNVFLKNNYAYAFWHCSNVIKPDTPNRKVHFINK